LSGLFNLIQHNKQNAFQCRIFRVLVFLQTTL
jgi:hypothetical protein